MPSKNTPERTDPYRIMHTLQNIQSIGAVPAVSIQVFRKLNSPHFTFEAVSHLIMQDPAICSQILRISNSVYYTRGYEIATISQAVAHLGLETIKRILFAIEVMGIYPNNLQQARFDDASFWKSTLAGAILAGEIGAHNNYPKVESFYLAALLRDLGMLVIRQFFPVEFEQICEYAHERKVSFFKAEEKITSLNHREIAYLVAVRWGLPREVYWAYREETNQAGEMRTIYEMVQLVDAILAGKKYGQWDRCAAWEYPPDYLATYRLSDEYLTHLCDGIFTEVDELSKILNTRDAYREGV